MKKDIVGIEKINEVFQNIINVVEDSKSEMYDIVDIIRKEYDDLLLQLQNIREEAIKIIDEVDQLEGLEKNSRQILLEVSKNFTRYSEEDIQKAYEKANILQMQLMLKRQKERELITRRTEIERRIKRFENTLKKAENLTTKIDVIHEFLDGNVKGISSAVVDIEEKYQLGRKVIHVQEEERKRVARDIHDGPAQLLTNLVIKTELCEKLMDIDIMKAKEELSDIRKCARESINDIRGIIYNLRPMSIDDIGFVPAIQRYIEDFEKDTRIDTSLTILSQIDLEDRIKNLSIFRIVQEALNNIKKHSQADTAKVKIDMEGDNINIYIEDDGVGFDINEVERPDCEEGGFGLINIKERAELLKGNFNIKSEINRGTSVMVSIPRKT